MELRKVLSSHSSQSKRLPLPLISIPSWADGQQREEVLPAHLRCSEQGRWTVCVSFPELEEVASLACTHACPQKPLRLGGTSPSLCTSSPRCDTLGWRFNWECIAAVSGHLLLQEALSLPGVLVIEIMCYYCGSCKEMAGLEGHFRSHLVHLLAPHA